MTSPDNVSALSLAIAAARLDHNAESMANLAKAIRPTRELHPADALALSRLIQTLAPKPVGRPTNAVRDDFIVMLVDVMWSMKDKFESPLVKRSELYDIIAKYGLPTNRIEAERDHEDDESRAVRVSAPEDEKRQFLTPKTIAAIVLNANRTLPNK